MTVLLRTFVLVLLVLFVFIFPLNRPDDPDVWFHLSAGRHIWQTGEAPTMDTFLFSYPPDGPRHSHEWLFQALVYRLHALAGMEGVVAAKAALIAASFLMLFFSSLGGRRFYASAAFLVAAYAAGSGRFYIRPEIAGGFIFALQWIIISRTGGFRGMAALLALQVLWTNLHWSSILGVALAGAFAAAGAAGRFLPLPKGWQSLPPGGTWQGQLLLFAGFVFATLVNPDGVQPFIEPFRYLGAGGFALPVAEVWPMHWIFFRKGPVSFHHWFFVTAAAGFVLFAINRRNLNLPHLFTFAGLFLLAMLSERHALFFALAAVPVSMANLPAPDRQGGSPLREAAAALALLAVLTTLILNRATGVSFLLPYPRPYEPLSLKASTVLWPDEGARFVLEKKLPDNIFNDFNSGNYLNWAIYPRRVYMNGTFSDLRTSRDYARLRANPKEWSAFSEARHMNSAFFRLSPLIATPGLVAAVLADPDWSLVSYDGVGAVFVRTGHPAATALPAVDLEGELRDALQAAGASPGMTSPAGLSFVEQVDRYRERRDLARLFRLRGRFYLLADREDLAAVAADFVERLER